MTEMKTTEQTIAERRAEIAERIHVVEMADHKYHVLEIPGRDGKPVGVWPGPFASERGAQLFFCDLLDAYVNGDPETALAYPAGCGGYDLRASMLTFLEAQKDFADLPALAKRLCDARPWQGCYGDEIPF